MMRKVKVVHIISNLQMGDADTVLYELVKRLDKKQFEQEIIYFSEGSSLDQFEKLGVSLHHVKGFFFSYDLIFFAKLFFLVKKLQPDCVHAMLPGAIFWGRIVSWLLKVPAIHTFYSIPFHAGVIGTIVERLSARLFPQENVVAVSESVAQSLRYKAPWIKDSSITVIRNGFDRDYCELGTSIERESIGLLKKHFVIGSVGRFEKTKNYGLLLTSFALLYDEYPDMRLLLIGEGKREKFLKQRAFDLGISDRVIVITDQLSNDYYSLFDCFVIPSFDGEITVGLLEAMGKGIPSIATQSDKGHTLIQNKENGLLVSAGDAYELSKGLVAFFKNKSMRKKIGQNAKMSMEQYFTAQEMVDGYAQLYKSLTESVVR